MDAQTIVAPAIRELLPDTRLVYLFGSQAMRATHASSDVDVAVLTTRPLDARTRFDVQERLAVQLHRDVDLVDLRRAPATLRAQIVVSGQLLYELDPTERAHFEAMALAAYARLNEERRGILADIRARGTVHG